MSQIWALTVFESTLIDRVANSTPMVDLDSRLNSLRVNRESTAGRGHAEGWRWWRDASASRHDYDRVEFVGVHVQLLFGEGKRRGA